MLELDLVTLLAPTKPLLVVLYDDATAEFVVTSAAFVDVGDVTPDVNGTVPELAPEKAVATPVMVGFGPAVLFGFRTESMTWMTPFAIRISALMMRAALTKIAPFSILTVRFLPFIIVNVPFLRLVE